MVRRGKIFCDICEEEERLSQVLFLLDVSRDLSAPILHHKPRNEYLGLCDTCEHLNVKAHQPKPFKNRILAMIKRFFVEVYSRTMIQKRMVILG